MCKSFSIVLTTFIFILLVSTSPLTGISSSTLFQDRINDVTQNNLIINSVFASSDETGDDNNGAGDEDQGGSDETGDDNNGAGDEDQGGSDETGDDNNGAGDEDQGGSDETGDDNNGAGDEQQLPANTALTAAPNTLINGVEQQLPANSGLSDKIFDPAAKPTPASCEAQGAVFNPATGMCESTPVQIDPSKITKESCEARGTTFNEATGRCNSKPPPVFDPAAKPTPASCEAQGAVFNQATGMCANKPPESSEGYLSPSPSCSPTSSILSRDKPVHQRVRAGRGTRASALRRSARRSARRTARRTGTARPSASPSPRVGPSGPIVSPNASIVPACGRTRPRMERSSTDLPVPDAPTMARISPRRTSTSRFSSTVGAAEADGQAAHADDRLAGAVRRHQKSIARVEDGEDAVDHDHHEDRLHHRRGGVRAERFGAAAHRHAFRAGDQRDDQRHERRLDEAAEEARRSRSRRAAAARKDVGVMST